MIQKIILRILAAAAALTVTVIPLSGEWNVDGLLYAVCVLIPAALVFAASFAEKRLLKVLAALTGIWAGAGLEIYYAVKYGALFVFDYQKKSIGAGVWPAILLFAAMLLVSLCFGYKNRTNENKGKESGRQDGTKFCPVCGKANRASASFCRHCGARMGEDVQESRKEGKRLAAKGRMRRMIGTAAAALAIFALIAASVYGTAAYWGLAEIPVLAGILEKSRGEEECLPNHITGVFTDLEIVDGEGAIAAAQDAAGLLGLASAADELSVKSETQTGNNTFYRLQQNYYGIPVYGRTMTVVAGEDGTARGITSNAIDLNEFISTEPAAAEEEVEQGIKAYVSSNMNGADADSISIGGISEQDRTIYTYGEGEPQLAYRLNVQVTGAGAVEFIISADDAEVLSAVPAVYEEKSDCYNADGTRRFDGSYDKDENQYVMHDEERGIYVATYEGRDSDTDSTWTLVTSKSDNRFGNVSEENYDAETAITYLANITSIYDYYKQSFNETAYGMLIALYNDGYDSGNNAWGGYGEQQSGERVGMISMGTNTGVEDVDTMAHEYTHVVTYHQIDWVAADVENCESGAVNEGYSDIFGEIIEGYLNSSEPDWVHDSSRLPRSIEDPEAYGYPTKAGEKRLTVGKDSEGNDRYEHSVKNKSGKHATTDYSHGHSTIVSHAAYNMHTGLDGEYEVLDMGELAKLWYETMLLLPGDCTFQILREYMEMTADLQGLSDGQKECIRAAFDNAGIESQDEEEGTYSTAPEITVLDKKGNPYDDYTITIEGKKDTGFAWLWKEEYTQEIVVEDTDPEVLELPRGVYTVTVTDNFNPSKSVSREIKVRLTSKEKNLRIPSNFGFDYTASTAAQLAVYDINQVPYDDYTVQVNGTADEENRAYENSWEISSQDKVQLNLPEGKYGVLLKDRKDPDRQRSFTLRILDGALERTVSIKTDFGVRTGEYNPAYIPDNAVQYNGHYYFVYRFNDDVDTWEEAREFCLKRSGYLASLTSAEEDAFVHSLVQESGCEYAYFGLNDTGYSQWEWSNGEKFEYSNWAQGEPNAYGERYGLYDKGMREQWNNGSIRNGTDLTKTGFVCEWGEYTPGDAQPILAPGSRTMSDERDIVLVLDSSGSMEGTPIAETKEASLKFIQTVLSQDASTGVVTYAGNADVASDFCMDENRLDAAVNEISAGGGTNIEAGLETAFQMLQYSNARKKIIVLMSDGEPTDGRQGDSLIEYADGIKDTGISVYTLGFFSELGEGNKASAQLLMEGIASEGCHYEVDDASNLEFFFDDIADQINGQGYIYVRIACPVDVTVTHKGETLTSETDHMNTRTSFGTLTFEEAEEEPAQTLQEEGQPDAEKGLFSGLFSQESQDDGDAGTGGDGENEKADSRVKILRLKDDAEYDVEIQGTGSGTMDYTIGFMDEEGEYSDFRQFEDIAVSDSTRVDTTARRARTTVLNVDEDGDGRYELKYRAGANETGKIVDYTYVICLAAGAAAAAAGAAAGMIIRKRKKQRERR